MLPKSFLNCSLFSKSSIDFKARNCVAYVHLTFWYFIMLLVPKLLIRFRSLILTEVIFRLGTVKKLPAYWLVKLTNSKWVSLPTRNRTNPPVPRKSRQYNWLSGSLHCKYETLFSLKMKKKRNRLPKAREATLLSKNNLLTDDSSQIV